MEQAALSAEPTPVAVVAAQEEAVELSIWSTIDTAEAAKSRLQKETVPPAAQTRVVEQPVARAMMEQQDESSASTRAPKFGSNTTE